MPTQLITLTTDFGEGSPYVAQMKAAALSVNSQVSLIDISHSIAPHDVRHGAIVLADTVHQFPPGTVHVCVVDPGVGTSRKIVFVEIGAQRLIAPDNGLLSLATRGKPASRIISVESPGYWCRTVSATFHGRDIMAPVAAHLTLGVDPLDLGTELHDLTQLDWPEVICAPGDLKGCVVFVDHFGNLITNITRAMLPDQVDASCVRVDCGDRAQLPLVETYGQAEARSAVALFGSGNRLEVAITNGNAARTLACKVGDPVRLTWVDD